MNYPGMGGYIFQNLLKCRVPFFCAKHNMKFCCRLPVCVQHIELLLMPAPCFPHKSFEMVALPGFAQFFSGSKSGFHQAAGYFCNDKTGINNGT